MKPGCFKRFFHAWERRLASVRYQPGRPAVRLGARLDTAERPETRRRPARGAERLDRRGHGRHRRVLLDRAHGRVHARRRCLAASASLTFPSALETPACREQHGLLPAASRPRAASGPRAAVLVLPQWNSDPGGHVGLCRLLAHERHARAAPQPALSRRPDAAGAAARRLHRQLERRPDRAGVPPGGARRAARRGLARTRGVRADRHPRHEPRLLSGAADDGPRAAHPRAGAEPHLAVLRRRRLARPVHAARARRGSTATSSSICCARSGSRSARGGTWSACAIDRRCWCTRATT